MPKGIASESKIGEQVGALSVIAIARNGGKTGLFWLCICECGRYTTKATCKLTDQATCRECRADKLRERFVTHGASSRTRRVTGKPSLYTIWVGIRRRCEYEGDSSYRYYGAAGIRVCPEWSDYAAFEAWAFRAGYVVIDSPSRAERLSIERIDPYGDYCPANCEWITMRENVIRGHQSRRERKRAH